MKTLRRALGWRGVPLLGAALALLLTLPALSNRWYFDDLPQRLVLLRHPQARVPPSEMFSFIRGDPQANREYMNLGTLPWWSDPQMRAAFWRPLTVRTHQLDYVLWPTSAKLMHLHSLLWLVALVLCAGLLYRRIQGVTWVAGLSALLYAIDDAHGFPAGWLANRNALVATTFGLLALLCHDRWRRGAWGPGRFLGPGLFAAALLSGEFGLGAGAYLVAHAVVLDPDRGWRRFARLVPYAAVFLAWGITYAALGYGTTGSGLYVDPLRNPLDFVRALFERAPVLLLGQWALPYADTYSQMAGAGAFRLWLFAIAMAAWIGLTLAPLLRRDAIARFWGLGMVLALVPVCATFPANRLLFFVGLGAMGLIAQLLGGLVDRAAWVPSSGAWRRSTGALVALLLPIHLVLAPIQLPIGVAIPRLVGTVTNAAMLSAPADEAITGQDLVIVNAPDHLFFVASLGVLRLLEDLPLPRHLRGLVGAPAPIVLTRPDERSLRADVPDGVLRGTLRTLFRSPRSPLIAGNRVRLEGMMVEVLDARPEDGPVSMVFRFDTSLEDSSLRWVHWENGAFVRFRPPAVGDTVRLPAARGPLEMTDVREMMEAYRTAEARLGSERP